MTSTTGVVSSVPQFLFWHFFPIVFMLHDLNRQFRLPKPHKYAIRQGLSSLLPTGGYLRRNFPENSLRLFSAKQGGEMLPPRRRCPASARQSRATSCECGLSSAGDRVRQGLGEAVQPAEKGQKERPTWQNFS
jgi:hypothetical protein